MGLENPDEIQAKMQEILEQNRKLMEDYQALQEELETVKKTSDEELEKRVGFHLAKVELQRKYPDVDFNEVAGATIEEMEAKAKAIQEKIDAKVKAREEELKQQFAKQWGIPIESAGVGAPPVAGEDYDKKIEEAKSKRDIPSLIAGIFGKHKDKVQKWLNG